jgi:hypothetical protein
MKIAMKLLLTLMLLGQWAVAIAQAPPGDDPEPGAATPPAEAPPDLPAEEDATAGDESADAGTVEVDPADEAAEVVSADAEATVGEPEDAAAEDAAAADDALDGPGALVEEDPAVEATAQEEFDPDEEISEDYPVPLPSDI